MIIIFCILKEIHTRQQCFVLFIYLFLCVCVEKLHLYLHIVSAIPIF